MKKLLIILTLGLMFGQTKLETRLYDLGTINFSNDEVITLDLYSITGYDLEFAYITFGEVSDVSYSGNSFMEFNLRASYLHYEGSTEYTGKSVYAHQGGSVNYNNLDDIIYDGENQIQLRFEYGIGSANIQLKITAEFPIEDTGYMEEDFDFCINEGLNLVSYPCENDIAINDALPSEISNNLSSIVGEGVAGVNVNGTWVGSLTQLQAGSGCWFKSNIEACFNYTCAEN